MSRYDEQYMLVWYMIFHGIVLIEFVDNCLFQWWPGILSWKLFYIFFAFFVIVIFFFLLILAVIHHTLVFKNCILVWRQLLYTCTVYISAVFMGQSDFFCWLFTNFEWHYTAAVRTREHIQHYHGKSCSVNFCCCGKQLYNVWMIMALLVVLPLILFWIIYWILRKLYINLDVWGCCHRRKEDRKVEIQYKWQVMI